MLNERRTLGLMRLRGISGQAMGRALQIAIVSGGAVGGVLGLVAGSIGPLFVYERGRLPIDVLTQPAQLCCSVAFWSSRSSSRWSSAAGWCATR